MLKDNTIYNMKILYNLETHFERLLKLYSKIKGSEFNALLVIFSFRQI